MEFFQKFSILTENLADFDVLTCSVTLGTLLFYNVETYKKGPSLILPSSIARNSSAP